MRKIAAVRHEIKRLFDLVHLKYSTTLYTNNN